MSDILENIQPWIATVVFEAITFEPHHDDDHSSLPQKKQDRKSHLAQVLQPPQPIVPNKGKNKLQLSLLFLSDGKNSIAAYIPSSMEARTLAKGSLVRLRCKHWSVSLTCFMGHGERISRDDFCLVFHKTELKYDSHRVMLDDDASDDGTGQKSENRTCSSSSRSSRPCIECIGCEGMGIVGEPMDVHSDLDVRRALVAIPNSLQRCRQIIDCLNYTLQRDAKDRMEGIFPARYVPCGGDLIPLASFDLYPNRKCMKILSDLDEYFEQFVDKHQALEKSEKTVVVDGLEDQYLTTAAEDFASLDALETQVEMTHHQGTQVEMTHPPQKEATIETLANQSVDEKWNRQDSPCGLSWSPMSSIHARTPLSTQPTSTVRGISAMLDDSSSQDAHEEEENDSNHKKPRGNTMPLSLETFQPNLDIDGDDDGDDHVDSSTGIMAHDGQSQLETQQPYHEPISNGITLNVQKGNVREDHLQEITQGEEDLETQPFHSNFAIPFVHDRTLAQEKRLGKKR
jgi:hypothetical protein